MKGGCDEATNQKNKSTDEEGTQAAPLYEVGRRLEADTTERMPSVIKTSGGIKNLPGHEACGCTTGNARINTLIKECGVVTLKWRS